MNLSCGVDSYEQPIERPTDYKEQKKYYSGKPPKRPTLKNQIVVMPNGRAVSFSGKPAFCRGRAPVPTLPIHDLLGVSLSWGRHGGQPLQENETALCRMAKKSLM
ncbi:transposase family protein [Microcoleus sp. F10-C6]|uniref:transposase family protein n=1 Tax=unclassified Microcoleus TaxID=2642155 RepID=UPI002FCF86F0